MSESYTPYEQGFADGLTAYAVNNDGVQYVGSTGTTRIKAIEKMHETWNFAPPDNNESELLDALVPIIWKSIDKDNMEFQATITCYGMDKIHAAIKNSKG